MDHKSKSCYTIMSNGSNESVFLNLSISKIACLFETSFWRETRAWSIIIINGHFTIHNLKIKPCLTNNGISYLIKSRKESLVVYGFGSDFDPSGLSVLPGLMDETKTIPKMAADKVVVI